jgi:hypothetical protein
MGPGAGGPALGGAPSRTLTFEPEEEEGEELGPVAKALLEALKESGAQDLLKRKDEGDD